MENKKKINCELCNSPAHLKFEGLQGYQLGMKFNIFICENCATSFSMPRPDTTEIYNAIYSNGKDVPGYNRYWSYMDEVKTKEKPLQFLASQEEAFWGIQQALQQLAPEKTGTQILEIGSGLGYLTYSLRKEGYSIQGLDISTEAVEQAKNNFGDFYMSGDVHEYAEENPNSYDIVILTEVIEHIEKPMAFIGSIKKLVKENGNILITTPNKTIIPIDVIWDSEAPPVHHWWFSEKSLEYIAETLSLGIRFINFTDYYLDHPEEYKHKKRRKSIHRNPILDDQNRLIDKSQYFPETKSEAQLQRKAAVKRNLLKIKKILNPTTIIFSERGKTMCAVLEKSR